MSKVSINIEPNKLAFRNAVKILAVAKVRQLSQTRVLEGAGMMKKGFDGGEVKAIGIGDCC